MAVTYPIMRFGMYFGTKDNQTAKLLLDIRDKKVIPGLKCKIFDFPPDLVLRALDEHRSIRSIIKEEGIDHNQYIAELRDYQTVGTAFMYLSPRSIIADGVGLGKTAEIAALMNYLREQGQMKRFIMAVETSALGQTQCEIIRFTGLNVVQLPSEQAKMEKVIKKTDWNAVDGVIMKHSALRSDLLSKWLSLYLDENYKSRIFDTFIFDESSAVKNKEAKTYKYTVNLCNIVNRVHFMNATAFETNIMDIYNQIDMMDPSIMPKKWRIDRDYCEFGRKSYWKTEDGKPVMKWNHPLSGYKNQSKFKESLKLFYFGRSKKDIGMDRPNQYLVYEVEPSTEQSLALSKGYRYMEVLNCPSAIQDIHIKFNRENVPKLDRLIHLVENDFVEDKIMIYCFHLDAQRVIAEELRKIGRNPVVLNGSNTDQERWAIMQNFNKGDADVIVTNIKKSLNLYGGDVCIFYTVETNPSKMFQIAGRVDRNVDDKIKTFVLLIYKGTDEHRFFNTVVKQRAQDSRDLTIDAKTTVDWFIENMQSADEDTNG